MKKIVIAFLVSVFIFSFGTNSKAEDESTTDWLTEQDAKISPYVYSLLLERAGFSSYIYLDRYINLNPNDLDSFVVEERYHNFIIGSFDEQAIKILVTNDGLFVSYVPKDVAHTTFLNNHHFAELQDAIYIFEETRLQNANYINFASLNSNKALAFYGNYNFTDEESKLALPTNISINNIGFAYTSTMNYYPSEYGTVSPSILQPGATHTIHNYGKDIDDQRVYHKDTNIMSIFYTGNQSIEVLNSDFYNQYDLTNKFVPVITDMMTHLAYDEVSWAVKQGIVKGYEDGSFKPENVLTESQFVSVLSKYFGIDTSGESGSATYDPDRAYMYLKKYNFPLKGYTNKAARNEPITRGVVAQILSMTQGGSNDLQEAYEFLYNHKLTIKESLQAYNPQSNLKRSHISSFFKRMNDAGFMEMKTHTKELSVGDIAPDFELLDLDGNRHRLSDYRGKGIYLNFFGAQISANGNEMSYLESFHQLFGDNNVRFLAINLYDPLLYVDYFRDIHGITFPILPDTTKNLGKAYNISALSTTVLINKDGRVEKIVQGSVSQREMLSLIESIHP